MHDATCCMQLNRKPILESFPLISILLAVEDVCLDPQHQHFHEACTQNMTQFVPSKHYVEKYNNFMEELTCLIKW